MHHPRLERSLWTRLALPAVLLLLAAWAPGAVLGTNLAVHDRCHRPADQHLAWLTPVAIILDHGAGRHGDGKQNVMGVVHRRDSWE